jgi:hypothetical protein
MPHLTCSMRLVAGGGSLQQLLRRGEWVGFPAQGLHKAYLALQLLVLVVQARACREYEYKLKALMDSTYKCAASTCNSLQQMYISAGQGANRRDGAGGLLLHPWRKGPVQATRRAC